MVVVVTAFLLRVMKTRRSKTPGPTASVVGVPERGGSTSIVVPAYNEAARIQLPQFDGLFAAGVRVLFVDDGSTDETRTMLQALASRQPKATVLVLAQNSGKAEAVRLGLLAAIDTGAQVVGYLDADLATPPSEMQRVVGAIGPEADVSMGSRVALLGRHIERTAQRHYLGRVFATMASWALGLRVYDTQCGAKAFAVTEVLKTALAQPFSARWAFDVELLSRLLAGGLESRRIIEVPLREWREVPGSKLRPSAMLKAGVDVVSLGLRRPR